MPVKYFKIESTLERAVLVAAAVFCLICVFFFAKWELANTITVKAEYKEVAEVAVHLAPSDPQTHYVWAGLLERTFIPEDLPHSVAEYENAAALSPNNFLMWLALGKSRERSGDQAGAETALRKAQELAPNYAQIQWTLGNLLLREDKTDEAFAQMQKAAAGDANFTAPVVAAAWQNFDGDLDKVRRAVGNSPLINSALAVFLAKQKRLDEAFSVWNSLPADGKKTDFKANGLELYNQFTAAKKYLAAQRVAAQIGDAETVGAAGQFFNGGFESDLKMQSPGLFEWQIADAAQPQIGYDDQQKHGGTRSLAMVFNSSNGNDFRAVSQIVTVEAGRAYALDLFYKSDLKTTATFVWEIADAADGKLLAATTATDAKTADWTKLSVKFTAPAASEAVIVRLARSPCKTGSCPNAGRLLFDDFSLTKLD